MLGGAAFVWNWESSEEGVYLSNRPFGKEKVRRKQPPARKSYKGDDAFRFLLEQDNEGSISRRGPLGRAVEEEAGPEELCRAR